MVSTKAGSKIPQALKAASPQSTEAVFGYQSQRKGGLSILKRSAQVAQWPHTGQSRLFKYTVAPWKCEKKPPEIEFSRVHHFTIKIILIYYENG